MRESFKFVQELVPLVLSGEKDCTWRLWDDAPLNVDDEVDLVARPELRRFARAKITSVISKLMGELNSEDHKGHEPFVSDTEMYQTYSRYYRRPVTPSSPVRVYHFSITHVEAEYQQV